MIAERGHPLESVINTATDAILLDNKDIWKKKNICCT